MNLWNLCSRSVFRKRRRTLLLGLLVFAISVSLYVGWSLEGASVLSQDKSRQAIGASFRLEENEENRHVRLEQAASKMGEAKEGSIDGYHAKQLPTGEWLTWVDNSFETLLSEDIAKIAAVRGISDYNIVTANTVVAPVGFDRIEDPDMDQSKDQGGVSLRGERNMRLDFEVQRDNLKIVSGRMVEPGDRNVCVISKELAEHNALQVGDTVAFHNWKEKETGNVCRAEIVGIYASPNGIAPIMNTDSYRSENIIFTDLGFPEKAEGKPGDPLYQYAVFTVSDVDAYEEIKQEILSVPIAWERYDLLDNSGMTETVASNYGELKSISRLFLAITFVSGAGILFLAFLFWIKGRRHEIGVFLAIGRSKISILSQILLEGVLVSVIAFAFASGIAVPAAGILSTHMAEYELSVTEEQAEAEQELVMNSAGETQKTTIGVSAKPDAGVILISGISVFGIIVISVLLSGITVMIRQPGKLLSQMS